MMILNKEIVKLFVNLLFAGFLLLVTATSNLDQFVGLLFLYLFISFSQMTRETSSRQYFNLITLAGITLITFKFELSNTARIFFLIGITGVFFLIYQNQLNFHNINYTIPNLAFFVMIVSLKLLQNISDWLIQFLGYGYDNAFHIMMFRGYRLSSWFPSGSQSSWWTDFNLFKVSPPGSSALFSIFSNVLIGAIHDANSEMASFFIIQISMLFALISISIVFVINHFPKNYDKRLVLTVSTLLVPLIIYSTGTMLVNGFPPYVAVTLVLAYWMRMQPLLNSYSTKLLNLTFAAFVVLLITPGPFAFLIVPGLYLSFKLISEYRANRDFKVFFVGVAAPLVLGGISYFEFRSTSGSFGWRQILAPGGVHRPSLLLAIFITLVFILISFKCRSDFLIWLLIVSGFLSTALLSAITIIYTGSVQYYAVKQLYVWLPLTGIFIMSQIWKTKFFSKNRRREPVAAVIGFFLVSSLLWSSSSSSGWMGTPISAVRNLANQSLWNQSIIFSRNFPKEYTNENSAPPKCIILRINPSESDLNSRWANALTNPLSMSSKCFDGYWNSSPLSTVDLINRLRDLQENYLLVLPLNDKESFAGLSLPDNVAIRFK